MHERDHKGGKRKEQESDSRAYHEARKAWRDFVVRRLKKDRDKCVALLLQEFANPGRFSKEGKLIAWPSQEALAEILGIEQRTVGRGIKNLKKSGFVIAKKQRRHPARYELVIVPMPLDVNVINLGERRKNGQHAVRSKKTVTSVTPDNLLSDLGEVLDRTTPHLRPDKSTLKIGHLGVRQESIRESKERGGAKVARLLEGATFAPLPEEQATLMHKVVETHFAGRLPPWLREPDTGDGLEAAMLTENQLLLALAHEHGRAEDFPTTYQVFEDDNAALEMLLAANEGTHRIVATSLAMKTTAEARRQLRNLSDDPAPVDLSESECEAIQQIAEACGADAAVQMIVHMAITRSMQ